MSHLIDEPFFKQYGRYSVFGFYVISGYLITRILKEVYQFDQKRFWINRALRLYPLYLCVLLISWVAVTALPGPAYEFAGKWGIGKTPGEIFANIIIWPLALSIESIRESTRMILPAWSIAVELQCYLALAMLTARSKIFALATFALAVCWHGTVLTMKALAHSEFTFGHIYFPLCAALLPFSIGSLLYFYKSSLTSKLIQLRMRLDVVYCIWLLNMGLSYYTTAIFRGGEFLFFYINLVTASILVALLIDRQPNAIDKWLGDLAYPIFLSHHVVHFVVIFALLGRSTANILNFLISFPFVLAFSFALAKLANDMIEPLRSKVRCKTKPMCQDPRDCSPA